MYVSTPLKGKKRVRKCQGVIRIHKSKDRQLNGQQKQDKQRSTNTSYKTKDRVKPYL